MHEQDLVTIASFPTQFEAELAKGFLENLGIAVLLSNVHMATIANDLLPITGGIMIQVTSQDAARTTEQLSRLRGTQRKINIART